MSARISPPFDALQGEDKNEDPISIKATDDGELHIRSRDVDSANIYEILVQIRNLLTELAD